MSGSCARLVCFPFERKKPRARSCVTLGSEPALFESNMESINEYTYVRLANCRAVDILARIGVGSRGNHWRRLSSPMSPGIITPLWGSFRTFVGQGRCPVGGVLSGPCTPLPPLGRIIDCSARDSVEPASPRSNVSVAARELWGQARRCGNLATPPRPWLVTVCRQATTPPPPGGRVRQRRHHPLIELVQAFPPPAPPLPYSNSICVVCT